MLISFLEGLTPRLSYLLAVVLLAMAAPRGAANTWSTLGGLTTPRTDHTSTLLPDGKILYAHSATLLPNGKLLVAGGIGSGVIHTSTELYDPAAGTWSATGSLSTARYQNSATLLPNGKALVAGGFGTTGYVTSAELYDPAAGTSSATGSLLTARNDHTATLLPNGKVLVAGGYNAGSLSSAEL